MQTLTSRGSVEWYTPSIYVDMARDVLGGIDLDPASSDLPQTWIKADVYYKLDMEKFQINPLWSDGDYKRELRRFSRNQLILQPKWRGRIWLNPPFDDTPTWVDRLIYDYLKDRSGVSAILLVNSNLGYDWYENMWRCFPICCAREKISFIKEDGTSPGPSKQAQTFVYFGDNRDRFASIFSSIGRILMPDMKPEEPEPNLFDFF